MNLTSPEFLHVLVALALLVGLGRALLELAAPNAAATAVERWALAFLLGTGGISLLSWWLSPLFSGVPAVWLMTVAILVIVTCAPLLARRHANTRLHALNTAKDTSGWSLTARALAAAVITFCAVVAMVSLATPLGWDGLFNYEIKARIAFLNEVSGVIPIGYFADASRQWSHPNYPLLLPLTETWLYGWIGGPNQAGLKFLFPLFYFSLIVLFFAALRRDFSPTWAMAGCVGLALVPAFVVGPGGATTGYADVPLAAFTFGAVSYARSGLNADRSPGHITLAAIMSALAAWTKREGLILASCLIAAVVLAYLLRMPARQADSTRWRRVLSALVLAPSLVVVPWWLFQQRHGIAEGVFLPVTIDSITHNIARIPTIAGLMGRELVRAGRWAALWPAFAVTALVTVASLRRSSTSLLTTMVLGPLAIYVGIFMLSALPNYQEHVGTALPRLLLSLAPIAWLATFLGLRDMLQKSGSTAW